MSSRRLALSVLTCAVQTLLCSVACSGNTSSLGAAGSGSNPDGSSGSNAAGAAARAGAGGALEQFGGAGGASGAGAATEGGGGSATAGMGTGAAGSGGSAMAGASAGGSPSGGAGGGQAGAGGASGCSGLTQTRSSRTGKSAGFSGDYQTDYYPLYTHACTTVADCSAACVTAGGTQSSCAASECVDSTPDYCLPPTYWFGLEQLLTEGNSQESSVAIIMVNNPYRDQLLASNFQFEIPDGAKILGISFSIREAAGSENMIADFSVRALSNNVAVGLDRGKTKAWTTEFHPEIYGGAADLWGTTWTTDAVNATGFGVALTPLYLDTAGNERAYVDFISATVTYDVCK